MIQPQNSGIQGKQEVLAQKKAQFSNPTNRKTDNSLVQTSSKLRIKNKSNLDALK